MSASPQPAAFRTGSLIIQTPEGCRFALPLAGPVVRFLAWFIDLLCVIAAMIASCCLLSTALSLVPGMAAAAVFLISFGLWFGYGVVLEWLWRGQTLGKRLLRLAVIDEHGLRLTFSQVLIRNLLRVVDSLPAMYLVGGLVCVLTRRSQRLGDLVATTVVIRMPRLSQPDLSVLSESRYNSFRQYPHLEGRLRQRVAPAAARVALEALRRRDTLDDAARVEVFRQIAEHFRQIAQFPAVATDGLSDEQYVRNVADSLFRPQLKARQKAAAVAAATAD